jgi:hypothetical protein
MLMARLLMLRVTFPMPHLKAEIKHLLINEGRLPVYPDH